MSEVQVIESTLKRAAARRRWLSAWRGLWQGLLIGAGLWLLALVLYKVFPIPFEVLLVTGAIAGVIMITGFIIGWWRRPSLLETACWVDGKHKLKERLSTALEFSDHPKSEEWQHLLVHDAAEHARGLDTKKLLPLSLPRAARWALLVLTLGAGLGFVPEYRSKNYLQEQKETEVIKEAGAKLVDLTQRSLKQNPPALEPTQKALEDVAELGNQLKQAKLSRSDALKDLASLSDKLKDQLQDLRNDPALRRMEQAARRAGSEQSLSRSDLQKQMDSLQKSLGENGGDPKELENLKDSLAKLQQAASGLPDANTPEGKAAREQLSQSLSDLAKKAEEMGLDASSLKEAIKALQGGQIDKFLKDMQALDLDLEKMLKTAKAMQTLQQQLAQIGKDLAEQLEKGQGLFAVATLKKMIRELEKANLSKEQLEQMTKEIDKAIEPGSQYGQVGEYLKQALKGLQQGQKQDASQSLADAAKEIERLMEQMGDSQSLMAALQNLGIAQMCVGTCQGWGMCNNPGIGKGGKPGSGVGTWADEDGSWWNGQTTEMWDNTGLERPDMDPRGNTDRGEGEVSDALRPSRVKGQMSPGGQMPSITLKGVSITGESKVAYQEAVTAAQIDAQSALNQDQVPRAYQGTVKDYFDDLKE